VGTCDAQTIDGIKPNEEGFTIKKCRDSSFHDTKPRVRLQSVGIDILVLCGIDTWICMEISITDFFNLRNDIIKKSAVQQYLSIYDTTGHPIVLFGFSWKSQTDLIL
jgi:isochorismate hydrolase